MSEAELYKELGTLTKDKSRWKESLPYVSYLLTHESVKIQAKVLWLLGEMGLEYPQEAEDRVLAIASFFDSTEPLLRERAVNALGRIGRGNYQAIEPFWKELFRFADDEEPKVRLSFIWASENIATNTPDIYFSMISSAAGTTLTVLQPSPSLIIAEYLNIYMHEFEKACNKIKLLESYK